MHFKEWHYDEPTPEKPDEIPYDQFSKYFQGKLGDKKNIRMNNFVAVHAKENLDDSQRIYEDLLQPYLDSLQESLESHFADAPEKASDYFYKISTVFTTIFDKTLVTHADATEDIISLGYCVSKKCVLLSFSNDRDIYTLDTTKEAFEETERFSTLLMPEATSLDKQYKAGLIRLLDAVSPRSRFVDTETGTLYLLFPLTN